MSKRLFSHDVESGLKTYFEVVEDSEANTKIAWHYEQDVEGILDQNKARQATGRDYWRSGGDWRHEASIPLAVQYKWLQDYGIEAWNADHTDKVVKLLNDPDWRYLKTANIII